MSGDQPLMLNLTEVDIWVQIYDLPIGFMSDKVAQAVGNFLGTLVEVDVDNFSWVFRSYMRIRVKLNVHQQLKQKMKLRTQRGESFLIHFKYEHLPQFCFYCGCLDHSDRFCSLLFDNPFVPKYSFNRVCGCMLDENGYIQNQVWLSFQVRTVLR